MSIGSQLAYEVFFILKPFKKSPLHYDVVLKNMDLIVLFLLTILRERF